MKQLAWLTLLVVLLAPPVVVGQAMPTTAPEAVGLSAERLGRITDLLEVSVEEDVVAGAVALVARKGKIAYLEAVGNADREAGQAMETDAIFRIASMSKAITSVAALMLFEEGRFLLDDPVSEYLPAFAAPKVLVVSEDEETAEGEEDDGGVPYELVPAERPITILNLLTHRSGLTYGFMGRPHLTEMYREAGIFDGLSQTPGTLAEVVDRLAALPLYRQPGEEFEYGLSTDALGRLIEVTSEMPLDEFLRQRIFEPLGMNDTFFFLPEDRRARLAALYGPGADGGLERTGEAPVTMGPVLYSGSYHYDGPRTYFSGGAGLVSTAEDYTRFLQMLINGGTLGETRLLGRKTVELMLRNQMPIDPESPDRGFGLGVGLVVDAEYSPRISSVGELSWGGFFGTSFFADPIEELVAVLLTQRFPNLGVKLREKFRVAVYQAIVD